MRKLIISRKTRTDLEDLHIDENSRVNPKDIEDTDSDTLIEWTISLLRHYQNELAKEQEREK